MNQKNISTSFMTTELAPDKDLFSIAIPSGKSAVIEVDYFAISATGKRISGKSRVTFTDVAGTATILDSAADPYQKKDAAGFLVTALSYTVALLQVNINVTGYAGQGDSLWSLTITYSII